ncbi:hypothetical protein BJX63DRAFT_436117 [Aspergillus granulosus]|uniref:Xylanolytic transcriptional activator regulatory domain-containing protein n=1 Tax=Aspergillus granulosus TaxID=176169 RepID=A0ABR4GZ12_9EURO
MPDRPKTFKFVASDSSGYSPSCKQTRRACENCRKRKRRCAHGSRLAPQSTAAINARQGDKILTVTETATDPTTAASHNDRTQIPPEAHTDGESRFVGNTDPEGALFIANRPALTSNGIRQHDLGVWLQLPLEKPRSSFIAYPDHLISSVLFSHLKEQCLSVLPSQADIGALLGIYMENIHPIFPVLDYEAYQSMAANSPEKTLLSQSICLAASRERRAKQYLRLPHMSQTDTSQGLSSAVTTLLALGLVQDKLILVQAMSLTSFSTQFSGDRQEPAELLSRAICHAHTLGLHHKCHASTEYNEKTRTRIFCCLYALDILTSACLGRPVQLHHRDFGRDLSSSVAAQEGCFQLFLRVIQLMDRVIDIYRPGEDSTWKGAFPSFQDLLEELPADMPEIPMHLIATIEVLYHAVAILSCHSTNLHGISRTRSSESHIRQSLSTSRVTYIVGEEFRNKLSLFPFIPYAVALALRASYHNLHQSKAAIFRDRARKQFNANCQILRQLGDDFYSASLMADLAERLINETARQEDGDARGNQEINAPCPPDDAPLEARTDLWGQGDSMQCPDLNEARSHDIGLFDPMSFLGIFDNFEHEIEAFGGMGHR